MTTSTHLIQATKEDRIAVARAIKYQRRHQQPEFVPANFAPRQRNSYKRFNSYCVYRAISACGWTYCIGTAIALDIAKTSPAASKDAYRVTYLANNLHN